MGIADRTEAAAPPAQAPATAVAVEHAVRRLENGFSLEDVSIAALPRASAAVVGEGGCGKSLLLRCVAGRMTLDSGSIRLLGLDPLRHEYQLLRRVGCVPERAAFPPGLSIRDVARLCRDLCGMEESLLFSQLCARLDLATARRADRLDALGQYKLSIALALQKQPELLIADAPPPGVAEDSRRDLLRALHEFRPASSTALFGARSLAEAAPHASMILMMAAGRIHSVVDASADRSSPAVELQLGDSLEAVPAALPQRNEVVSGVSSR